VTVVNRGQGTCYLRDFVGLEMAAAEKVDSLEAAVEMAIAACDGNLRDTVQALVVANSFLIEEMERYKSLVSPGFVRGKLSLLELP
jgi:hypothetical protein